MARQLSPRGMTLVELLVSMIILMILSAAITGVLFSNIRSSTTVQSQAIVTSDVNIALTMLQNDLAHGGLGLAIFKTGISEPGSMVNTDSFAIRTGGTITGGDSMVICGTNTGSGTGRWNIAVDYSPGDQVSVFRCKAWLGGDTLKNCNVGDVVHIVDGQKNFVGIDSIIGKGPIVQTGTDTTITFTVAIPISLPKGCILSQVNKTLGGTVVIGRVLYSIDTLNRQLLRNGIPFLSNVEALSIRWMWDTNGDGAIDSLDAAEASTSSRTVTVDRQFTRNPLVMGVTIVTSSPTLENRVVEPRANINVWDDVIPLSSTMRRRYRNTYTVYVRPRNIGA